MPWTQISFHAPRDLATSLSDALETFGALSVTLQDAEDQPLLEPPVGETPIWDQVIVTALFADSADSQKILQSVQQLLPTKQLPSHQITRLEEKIWEREWMKDFHPMRFGQRTWICPSWSPPPDPDAINIMLDPGLAFGTGTHPTTALCLQWLDAHIIGGESVIDFGCGSGILAIAAAKLGASRVWAIDNDPQALIATENNAKNNAVQDIIHCIEADQSLNVKANILIANILANPLISLESMFSNLLQTDGDIVLSGILEEQKDSVINAYRTRFKLRHCEVMENWCRLDFKKC